VTNYGLDRVPTSLLSNGYRGLILRGVMSPESRVDRKPSFECQG